MVSWDQGILKFNCCRQVRTLKHGHGDKWLLPRASSLPPRSELPCSGIVRLTSRRIFKMALSTGGNDFARVVSTAPSHASFYERCLLFPYPYASRSTKNDWGGTRGKTGESLGKTRETRNNHPIIKSLTRLRLLLNIPISWLPLPSPSHSDATHVLIRPKRYEFCFLHFHQHLAYDMLAAHETICRNYMRVRDVTRAESNKMLLIGRLSHLFLPSTLTPFRMFH